ncbi:hypothetical protein [Cypionkella sinensis]|uniref:Uncharacterized protein n=1 Tax=Cypionkella sinensis TaxID=1756043 RepID=A0ABV7ISG3_9RHOB
MERAARALCRLRGLPEDTGFNGLPMWHSTVSDAMDVLEAALSPEQLQEMIPDHPFPELHDPKQKHHDLP